MLRNKPCLVTILLLLSTLSRSQSSDDYARAENLVRGNKLDEGISLLDKIVAAEPKNLKAYNLLGIALSSKGDLAAANHQYQKALQIDPGFVPVLKNLAINELAQNDIGNAQKHLTTAEKLAPNDPLIHLNLGKIAYQ